VILAEIKQSPLFISFTKYMLATVVENTLVIILQIRILSINKYLLIFVIDSMRVDKYSLVLMQICNVLYY